MSICLTACWGNEFYKFLISALIIFFIFSICNTVGQQVDQKYTATLSKKSVIQAKLTILDLKVMSPHLHHEKGQLIQSCLFNPFKNNKIHFLFCNNTIKPPIFFIYSHNVPPFFQKMLNSKQLGNKLTPHSTNNLKPKKPCGQSSIKTFHEGLPGKGRLSCI